MPALPRHMHTTFAFVRNLCLCKVKNMEHNYHESYLSTSEIGCLTNAYALLIPLFEMLSLSFQHLPPEYQPHFIHHNQGRQSVPTSGR